MPFFTLLGFLFLLLGGGLVTNYLEYEVKKISQSAKTLIALAIIVGSSFAISGCGGGGDGGNESSPPEVIEPTPTPTPPPAVEGGDLPDISVDFTSQDPAKEGGFLPNIGVSGSQLLPLKGNVVKVKKADDGSFYFGIQRPNGETVWVLPMPYSTLVNGTTFFRDEDGVLDLVKYQTFVEIKGSESITSICKFIPEDGEEFCAIPIYNGSVEPIYPASGMWASNWDRDKGTVRLNEVDYKVSEFHNFETLELYKTSVVLIKKDSGDLIAVAQKDPDAPYEMSRLYVRVSKADYENKEYEYIGHDGNPVKMEVYTSSSDPYKSELKSIEVGDLVYISGLGKWGYTGPDFKVDHVFNLSKK